MTSAPNPSGPSSSPVLKALLLLGGCYVATLVGVGILCFGYMVVSQPKGCSALGDALLLLWGGMAAGAALGLVAAGVVVWRLPLGLAARLLLGAGFAVALLGTLVPVALMLVIVFNC
jgi:hypothetical protein